MNKTIFTDPERISEHTMGGPHIIEGWSLSDGKRTRLFNKDRTKMWFADVVSVCVFEGLNYPGHRLAK